MDPQKRAELSAHRNGIAHVGVYETLAATLQSRLAEDPPNAPQNRSAVFLQTASQSALSHFIHFFATRGVSGGASGTALSYTENPRSERDSWGGWDSRASVTFEGAVAAVNAYIGSLASVMVGPRFSSWTDLLLNLMGSNDRSANARPLEQLWLCCDCGLKDYVKLGSDPDPPGELGTGGNVVLAWIPSSPSPFSSSSAPHLGALPAQLLRHPRIATKCESMTEVRCSTPSNCTAAKMTVSRRRPTRALPDA